MAIETSDIAALILGLAGVPPSRLRAVHDPTVLRNAHQRFRAASRGVLWLTRNVVAVYDHGELAVYRVK